MLTENGDLACLKHDGTMVWQRNILKDFGGPQNRLADQRIAAGRRQPGDRHAGRTRRRIVALDKMTGKTIWTSKELSDEAGYSSPVVADVQGVRTVMTLTAEAGVGVRASDGS